MAANRMVQPERNGSVLLAFILINIMLNVSLNEISAGDRCNAGSKLLVGQVNSETLSNPKKAVTTIE